MDNSRRRDHAPTPANHATTNLLEAESSIERSPKIRFHSDSRASMGRTDRQSIGVEDDDKE